MKSTNILKATSLAILFVLLGTINSIACSSFALKTKTGMIYGRNLDSPDRITGSIFINKRGIYKESITFLELYLGRKLDVPIRLLAFWDKTENTETLVVASHGFIKKTQKTPKSEIEKAEKIRRQYFKEKWRKIK
ncbi:MAG: type II toxin-antitoxin system RelE/ParE family toxin [Bacteroidota bacterium]|nr:type II toxin-antitoxin system RelE/ParE family toxin [Bacteroidota bacterium]